MDASSSGEVSLATIEVNGSPMIARRTMAQREEFFDALQRRIGRNAIRYRGSHVSHVSWASVEAFCVQTVAKP
jgi:hypothetical protein